MKRNRGFTLVELIIVMACLGMVTLFFWSILNSSSEDSYTINDKIEVQTNVTALMNVIQQDVQEAKIYEISPTEKGIMNKNDDGSFTLNNIKYEFDKDNRVVTRTETIGGDQTIGVYGNIVEFSMNNVKEEKYGVEVKITGGKKPLNSDELDKSRYTLNSTYYTRNTL